MKLFSNEQLSMIQQCAIRCAQVKSGELSVYEAVELENRREQLFSESELRIIWFGAEECRRQNEPEGEMCVYWFVTAYDNEYTYSLEGRIPTLEQAYATACLIEPKRNNEYRCVPVRFRNGGTALAPDLIPRAMDGLFCQGGLEEYTPQQAYVAYEEIHPRLNGNGRYGKLLFNRLNGTLLQPEFPEEPAHFN